MEFQIPLSREDLLQSPGGGVQFTVSERLSAGELVSRLEECRSLMDTGGTDSIVECFPIFFSLLQNFLNVGVSVREGYWRIGVRGLEGVCRQVGGANLTTMTQIKKNELRNALKMMVYLVVQLVEEFETDATKPDSLDIASNKRGGSKKKKNAAAVAGSDSHSSGMDWGREREKVVDMTSNLVENDLWLLWEPPSVQMMEDFSNLLLSLCYKLLENPAFVRDKTGRDKVFGVMGSLMKRFNMGLGVGMKVPQLLQHFEHLVSPLAQAMHCCTQEYGLMTVVPEVVRELGRKDPRDLSQDTSGTRCFAAFLVELSQLVPTAILPSISVLMPHLSGESYTMRNGVLGVIGETVAGALSSPSLDDQSRMTRDKLLDRLEQHIHDVNAFVRSRCLQIWLQLAKAKAIPLPRLKAILPLVFGRTEDKSSNVRKNAVQLLTSVLAANPFAGKLSEEEFKSRLVAEEAKLKALLPSDTCNIDDVTSMVDKEGERGGGGEGEGEGGGGGGKEGEAEKAGEVAKQAAVVKYLRDGIEFIELMSSCVPVCTRLLGSKVNTDVLEALEFLATAHEFQVRGSADGVKKALGLVWSQEQQIKDSVVETYLRLFLRPQSDKPKQIVPLIVQNLISLTMDATHAQLSSLEQMMVLLMKGKNISAPVVKLLWDIFTKSIGNVTQSQSRSAILLLSMIAGADRQIANSNIRVLISHGLNHHGDNPDLVLARHCCVMLQKLDQSHSQTNKPAVPFRFPHSHTIFQEITSLLVSQFSSPASSQWTPFAEQAVATIYRLAEHPDRICGSILRSLVRRMSEREGGGGEREGEEKEEGEGEGEEREETETKEMRNFKFSKDVNSLTLSRLIFTAGHVAQWQVIHLETCVARELKRRREAAAEKEEEGERGGGGGGGGGGKGAKTPSSGARKTPRKTPGRKTVGGGSSPSLEEEMGLAGAAAEDVEGDMIRRVCEVDVGSTGLLSLFEPLIVSVVANPSKFRCAVLQTSAVLALSKYMMISQHLCEKYLQLLFTVLEKSADTAVRANTIIAAGDLAFRYPNLTEPWTPHLYARLQDPAPLVRKNTIIVLTHLILNDMIKVKGQISEMALVLEDKEESISAKARYFFSQLAKKGNDIYNVLPNIISHLSDPQRQVPRETFRNITRFLFSFVQKDKHCESLVEKICHRFRATGSEQQWRDLAHCLTQINFTDRCVRKLQDNFQCYQDKLVDRDIYTSFTSVTNKAKKFAKPETKALIVELEEMMKAAQQKGLEELEEEREGEGEGRGGGGGGGEGKGGEADEEGSGRKKKQERGDRRNTSVSPPPLPLSRKKAAKTTSKKPSKQVRLLTPAKVATERKKVKVKVNRTSERLKAPLVVSESDEDLDWNEDRDFRTDVLSSARRAVVNSGSLTRQKPVRRARGKKIRQLVFSSNEDEQSEREEEEEEERGEENLTERVPPRFTLSDDDI